MRELRMHKRVNFFCKKFCNQVQMLLTRTSRNQAFKGNASYSSPMKKNTKPKEPNVEEMILNRDFSGAVAVLEVCIFIQYFNTI